MIGKTSPLHNTAQVGTVTFKIRKPASNSAREIRDAILRDYFGYTATDIKELDAQQKGKFFICPPGNGIEREMTVQEVQKWTVESDGFISVPLNNYWLKNLNAFREQRASFEAFKVGMFINDTAIRETITDDLKNILLTSGEKRIKALNDLMVEIEGSGESHHQVFQALRFLLNESGYKDNPFLLLAFARAQIHNGKTPSIAPKNYYHSFISNALKAANLSLTAIPNQA